MSREQDRDFDRMEQELGSRLRDLPAVVPDPDFRNQLWQRLAAEQTLVDTDRRSGGRKRSTRLFNPLRLAAVAAACLLIVAAGWFGRFAPETGRDQGLGPLFLAQAQAQAGPAGETGGFGPLLGGLDFLRQVRFEVAAELPEAPAQAKVWRLKHERMSGGDVLNLAKRMGIENPQLDGAQKAGTGYFGVGGNDEFLQVQLDQGSWYYYRFPERSPDDDPVAPTPSPPGPGPGVTYDEMRGVALSWLDCAGLLPAEGTYTVTVDSNGEVVLSPTGTADNSAVVGSEMRIFVHVARDGTVSSAGGAWYAEQGSMTVPVIDYEEALDRLRRGEGVFERHPYASGVATVHGVDLAYRLAYALDFTPYLVPVAVFHGEFTPEGGESADFKASVSLLEYPTVPNAGNFMLETTLPQAPATALGIRERSHDATDVEASQVLDFFEFKGEKDEYNNYRGPKGEQLHVSSGNGGWLYRGPERPARQEVSKPLGETQLTKVVRELADALPNLPGTPGEPEMLEPVAKQDWRDIVFPLMYEGIPVASTGSPGYISYIGVQVGLDGEVWSVHSAQPMELTGEEMPLITPEQAWERLLRNESLVYVDGFFGPLPGKRFAAMSSRVTETGLVYLPRHHQIVRNEVYDLKYMFAGEAQVGNKQIKFTAFVDALK